MFTPVLIADATALLSALRLRGWRLATAESLTGGLLVALLTEVAGASDVVERGFVTYTNAAKSEMLSVPPPLIATHGAVSAEIACAMAVGALAASQADIAVAVTGLAGPGGGTPAKPVGLVHVATCRRGEAPRHVEHRFGDVGRSAIRLATVSAALDHVRRVV